jgi:hypothetical protein
MQINDTTNIIHNSPGILQSKETLAADNSLFRVLLPIRSMEGVRTNSLPRLVASSVL